MALITIIVGLFFAAGGVSVLLNPQLQGVRDVNLITSEEVGSAERATAYIAGVIILLIGLGFVYLGL